MTMANLRFQVVEEAFSKKPVDVIAPVERPSEYYGKYVFTRDKMYKYLQKDVYEKLVDVIDNGAALDRSIANAVAKGMKQWADERCLHRARRQGRHDRGLQRQTADAAGA